MARRSQAEAVPMQRWEGEAPAEPPVPDRTGIELSTARGIATRRSHRSLTLAAKVIGLVVFFVGIYLLWQVFRETRALFDTLAQPQPSWTKAADANSAGPTALDLGMAVGRQITQVLCLFVLGYVASLISGKGIQLFGAAAENKEAE
ncbi:MAG: hypothetical protein NZT92_13795 [Abditibacteriales bacterium]|nr:hypothetical protein [Abditibacteriales bacterium]MDW8367027.1 hypothetical protein [Abditibacteriales bacterium]